jgi:hypothetical protein
MCVPVPRQDRDFQRPMSWSLFVWEVVVRFFFKYWYPSFFKGCMPLKNDRYQYLKYSELNFLFILKVVNIRYSIFINKQFHTCANAFPNEFTVRSYDYWAGQHWMLSWMEENQTATYYLRSRLFTYDIMKNFNCNISLWIFKSKFRSYIEKHYFY